MLPGSYFNGKIRATDNAELAVGAFFGMTDNWSTQFIFGIDAGGAKKNADATIFTPRPINLDIIFSLLHLELRDIFKLNVSAQNSQEFALLIFNRG